ncbi:hypothetical protein SBA1_440046 [Candidatus Sulfotelmatobacter kueseliae]|uniref:Uncharacterized protein n=1 Tax=Candidatus Sulfotelmatobacter kueseliae TaxID=2042962 RepID=A0A2U3KRQ3_9BACT|nr:hypothetical protein SBA1_440046 [Candidatus Sulfotelmatobacter kueseliae]
MGMEAFGFNHALAMKAKSALAAVPGGLFFFSLIKNALFGSWRGREDEELAVGEDAINVEKKKFDFAGAGVSRKFWHCMNSSSRAVCAGADPVRCGGRAPGEASQ